MAGLINKLKDAVSGGSTHEGDATTHNTSSTYGNTGTNTSGYGSSGNAPHTQGPHNTDAANKADPRVDSDGDGRAGYEVGSNRGTGTSGTMGSGVGHPGTGVGTNTTSTPLFGSTDNHLGRSERQDLDNYENRHGHTSGLSNLEGSAQREGAYHQGTTGTSGLGSTGGTGALGSSMGSSTHTSSSGVGYGQGTTGTGMGSSNTTTTGPHNSSLMNKLDPRVDSDRDGSRTAGNTGSGLTGSGAGYSTSSDAGYPHAHVGLHAAEIITELKGGESIVHPHQHSHNLYMSDKIEDYEAGSGRHTTGDPNYGLTSGTHGTGSGLTGTHGTGSGLTGTHGTGSGLTGSHGTGTGLTGTHGTGSGLTGTHGTGSGLTGTHGTGSGLTGNQGQAYGSSGTTGGLTGNNNQGYGSSGNTGGLTGTSGQGYGNTTTSGPHNSNLANKADPRVDSDRDGSRLH